MTTFPAPSRLRRATAVATLGLALAACSPPVAGIYTDSNGVTEYEFRPDGQVYISVLGVTVSGSYEADAERILISAPQGTVVLLRQDGSLHGPMGLELRPKS